MDIQNSGKVGAGPQAPKTEFALDPASVPGRNEKVEKAQESFGSTLNRMAGVLDKKNPYEKDKKNEMSKESYLKMMMEQIKYQDPFNPVKNEQFTQNMAMMSQLEQQMNMNKTLEKIAGQNNNMQIAALQLVGKHIQADHAAIYHETGKFSNIEFELPQDARDLTVEVTGPTGEVLKGINLGTQNAGKITTKWDGLLENEMPVPSGKYSYRIKATNMEGQEISIPSKIDGRVTGVTNSQGVTYLLVGDQRVALNEVEVIKEPDSKAVPSAAVANFVNAGDKADKKEGTSANEQAANVENASGPKIATQVAVDTEVEKEMTEENKDLEKEHFHDLMQVMFR